MFNSGMRESRAAEVEIPCIGYETFLSLIEFLYCDTPRDDVTPEMVSLHCDIEQAKAPDHYLVDCLVFVLALLYRACAAL